MLNETDLDLQTSASDVLPRRSHCRQALEASAERLNRVAENLTGAAPDYPEALRDNLQAIRQAYRALLSWHRAVPPDDAPMDELARPAEDLASMLRTCRDRTHVLVSLEAALGRGGPLSHVAKEEIRTGYFTARNTLAVVIGSLPEDVTASAIERLNRAEAIRLGRIGPAHAGHRPGTAVAAPPDRQPRPRTAAIV